MALLFANNNSLSEITELPSGISGGALNLISTQTASASASLEFSLDDSYDSYIFKFYNIHPATNSVQLTFNLSTDGGSNYNVTKTSTFFRAYHNEDDAGAGLTYDTSGDLAQSTGYQWLTRISSSDNDHASSGYLHLYNPSSTTFVKHFIARFGETHHLDRAHDIFVAGYGNTSSPITNIKFQFSSGNIDDGIIKMYGVS